MDGLKEYTIKVTLQDGSYIRFKEKGYSFNRRSFVEELNDPRFVFIKFGDNVIKKDAIVKVETVKTEDCKDEGAF